jgi:thiamine pyrophosphate-dependent acetolactate synthase large subunit-like protein
MTTTSEIGVEALLDRGVDTIFGLPGDGINGFTQALREHRDEIRLVQTRHEKAAAFMACGHAKYTGQASKQYTSAPARPHFEEAVNLLNSGGDVAILAGRGRFRAHEQLVETSERLAAPHRQGAAREGCPLRRRPAHDRQPRPVRDPAFPGGDRELRHAVHREKSTAALARGEPHPLRESMTAMVDKVRELI